jgi:hypothetical protein
LPEPIIKPPPSAFLPLSSRLPFPDGNKDKETMKLLELVVVLANEPTHAHIKLIVVLPFARLWNNLFSRR